MVLRSVKAALRYTLPRSLRSGLLVGFCFAYVFVTFSNVTSPHPWQHSTGLLVTRIKEPGSDIIFPMFSADPVVNQDHLYHEAVAEGGDRDLYDRSSRIGDRHLHDDDDTVARQLAKQVRVLVWVMTSPKSLDTRARVVRETWGKRVDKLLFFSSTTNLSFPTIGFNLSEGRDHLTAKTMHGFRYVHQHHYDDADWFMKVDDDSFVVVENLLYFLSEENTQDPVYFGHHFGMIAAQGYYSGGGGYVLSKEALRRFAEHGHNSTLCRQDGGAEDAAFGKCMERLGVKTANTTDALGRSRFHCFDPETHIDGGFPTWYYEYDANGARQGLDSLSDYPITFHYVYPPKMLQMEFLVYHLAPFGINRGLQKLNKPPQDRVPIKPIYKLPRDKRG